MISDTYSCKNQSLAPIFISNNDLELKTQSSNIGIGEEVAVACKSPTKRLTIDKWDRNSSDNILHIRCRYDHNFDLPFGGGVPQCLSQCPTQDFLPNFHNMILEKPLTTEILENEKIW